ncbi:hypothetical protein F4779DRAFT_625066 [Xylariaceae sp. FL0662B]|nr:hypothetical protein F4779DRAFT_625066 [Xylariaceae sp. FL0662B]
MHPFHFIVACSLALIQPLAAQLLDLWGAVVASKVEEEPGPLLSNITTFFTSRDADWANETERYSNIVRPQIQLVVRPGTESDIPTIVQYANKNSIEFYTVSRGHALTTSVGALNGIEIDLRGLNGIEINPDNLTARFQGGVYSNEVLDTMANAGYVTATGTCSCVSILGPALGGGHGNQQGVHGLTSDGLVSMDVVLANGTGITVSNSSHPDLWWAMRGAGHNFGIVTSFEAKIYPDNKTYYYRTYEFSGDKLEPLYEELNKFHNNGTLSTKWFGTWGVYTVDTTVNETEATIVQVFVYAGPQAEAEPLFAPFDVLEPLKSIMLWGGGVDSPLCTPNRTHVVGTAGLQVYNVTTGRQIYDLYNSKIAEHPELGSTRVLHEGYAVKGVRDISSKDSAYPLRDDYLLMYFDAAPEPDSGLEDFAKKWAHETVALWNAGQPERLPTACTNYAAGDEGLEAILRGLKAQYDPDNKFAYYNPIIPPTRSA